MITGNVQHLVIQLDDEDTVIAVWGPFPSKEEADSWEGIPGKTGSYRTVEMRSAPQWFEGFVPNGEAEEGDSDG